MKLKLMLASMLVALSLVGCGTAEKDEPKTISELKVKADFNFTNADSIVKVKLTGGIVGAGFDILETIPEENVAPKVVRSGKFVDDGTGNGVYETTISGLPEGQKTVYVRSTYITQPSAEVAIVGNEATFNFAVPTVAKKSVNGKAARIVKDGFDCVSDYDKWGIPKSIVHTTLEPGLVKRLNAAFPEGKAISKIGTGDIELIKGEEIDNNYEVKITVVHEGAAYKNTLGYYTYPKGQKPTKASDIKDIKIVFPNYETGYLNSVGGNVLKAGDTVTLPVKFEKDVFIGFVVLQDGWKQGTGKIDPNAVKFYTDSALNSDKLQHTTAYYDTQDKRSIVGIEDISYGGDKDYNDLMFMINTKVDDLPPYEEVTEIPLTENYPISNSNTLAYEDLWPAKGDYDFNDQVINFSYELKSLRVIKKIHYPETNEVKTISDVTTLKTLTLNYKLKAVGAGLQSGWGFVLPVDSSVIKSVSGQIFTKQWPIGIDANGVETGSKAGESVILAYDNCKYVLAGTDNIEFINTVIGQKYYTPKERTIEITFNDNVDSELLTRSFPFNPFIYRSWERGLEVHLKNEKPTNKATVSYLGKAEDATNFSNLYYTTKDTYLPWALEINGDFKYPKEQTDIVKTYPQFYTWSVAAGTIDTNWMDSPVDTYIYK